MPSFSGATLVRRDVSDRREPLRKVCQPRETNGTTPRGKKRTSEPVSDSAPRPELVVPRSNPAEAAALGRSRLPGPPRSLPASYRIAAHRRKRHHHRRSSRPYAICRRQQREPGHDELCGREQRCLVEAIDRDIDLGDHMDDAVTSLRIVIAADQSVKTGEVVRM